MVFFQKMEAADLFVILDDVQYTKNNFQNRNKFQNKNGVDEWFSVELEQHANLKLIKDIIVSKNAKWKRVILNKLQTNFGVDFSEIYLSNYLVDINIASIEYCRTKLGITTPMVRSSELGIVSLSSQRLADICKHFNATEYISGGGGRAYLDESVFDCKVSYFHPNVTNYYTALQNI
jgi:hypothetical protein